MAEPETLIGENSGDIVQRRCPVCRADMRYVPGCCGHSPLWRCEHCGIVLLQREAHAPRDRYLTLK